MTAQSQGFSLIEVVVALAILSLSSVALLRLSQTSITSTLHSEQALFADMVAENALVTALSSERPPAAGRSQTLVPLSGQRWTVDQQVSVASNGTVLRIEIRVRDPQGQQLRDLAVLRRRG